MLCMVDMSGSLAHFYRELGVGWGYQSGGKWRWEEKLGGGEGGKTEVRLYYMREE